MADSFVSQLADLLTSNNCDTIGTVDAQMSDWSNILTRAQIIKQYKNKIKKMDGKEIYWIRYDGIMIQRKSIERVADRIYDIQKAKEKLKEEKEKIITLNSMANEFFAYRYVAKSSGTYGKDKLYYDMFIKHAPIASIPLDKITFADGVAWSQYCLSIKPEMKQAYWHNVRGTINQMMVYAIKQLYISQNPIKSIDIHRDLLQQQTVHQQKDLIFSQDEQNKVCELAYADAKNTQSAVPLAIPLLFSTGLRDGELCALKWADIKAEGVLHIQSEMVEQRNKDNRFIGYKYVGHTKTPAGERDIQINREVAQILGLIKEYNLANGYSTSADDFIFLRTYRGSICSCTTRSFETRIKKYCKQAGMETLKSQHDIRRTFATNLYYQHPNKTKNIQRLMGHSSLEQTMAYIKTRDTDDIDLNCLIS